MTTPEQLKDPVGSLPPLVKAFWDEVVMKYAPKAKLKPKQDSLVLKLAGKIIKPWNPLFLSNYITTLGDTIYIPDNFWTRTDIMMIEVLGHELQHIMDSDTKGLSFGVGYAFPQILSLLALLALGALWNPWMLGWLLCLGFLAPLPAFWRYKAELKGYRVTLLVAKYVYHYNLAQMEETKKGIVDQLSDKWYYYAFPFPAAIENELLDERFMKEPVYAEIYDFFQRHHVID